VSRHTALFLDRDGVINVDYGYVHRREDFQFHDGIFELCRAAQALHYRLVVVTNQAGIARGYYTEAVFIDLTHWMIRQFAERAIDISRVYFCPCHPVHGLNGYKNDCADRKPRPGMLLRAGADLDLDLSLSILVGDSLSDIDAARAAGIGVKILLRTGPTGESRGGDCHVADSLADIHRRFFPVAAPASASLPHEAEGSVHRSCSGRRAAGIPELAIG
jgi:D-glycero-D-manno-heptose 1,7-bisphosphate phosphatase